MYLQKETRREKREYQQYYRKASHQRTYIAQIGRWLGYTYSQMKDHFIWPGVNKDTFGTCQVKYRHGRWCIDEIPYSWDTGELIRELIRVEKMVDKCPDAAFRVEAKKWYRGKVHKARVIHYQGKITGFLLNTFSIHAKRQPTHSGHTTDGVGHKR